jgi:adenylylsulfate kinase|tara:strand:- start:3588 stop:4118 length:531 start_codon:yes stop_codon:yes gene_type:complete
MKKLIKNKNKGILFWVSGLSGSGKTTIAKKIKKNIINNYGPTLLVSGDNLRKIFNFKKYTYNERVLLSKKFCRFAKFITNQKINLIFAVVGMMHSTRKWYRDNVDNYVEIYIKADIKKIIKLKKKKIYHKKNIGDVVGITIKPELPKQPNIVINNNFKKSSDFLANNLVRKILKIV